MYIDSFIGLFNCCVFDEVLEWVYVEYGFGFICFIVLMIDVDFFKWFNDSYGYLVGDVCLCCVSEVLVGVVGWCGDVFGCYGGEEFVLVMFGVLL